MQTIVFKTHLDEIIVKLKAVKLTEFLEKIILGGQNETIPEVQKVEFSKLIFDSKEGFYSCSSYEEKKRVLYSFEFDKIFETTKLSKLITAFNNAASRSDIYGNINFLPLFSNFYYSLYNIILIQNAVTKLIYKEKLSFIGENEDVFEIQIYDFDNNGIEVTKINKVLNSIALLIENISRLLNVPATGVKISYVDSGSDFIFAIKSAKAIIDFLKLLYSEFWLKIRFDTYDRFDRKIDSLTKGLKFAELVQEQIGKNVVDEETGKIIIHNVISEMTNLIGWGILPKEIEHEDNFNNRKLLESKKDIKLLNEGSNGG